MMDGWMDLHWVRALTVLIHLGLMALCAPYSDISSGDPCPVTKFQMAPRLKILMSSGSKKGIQLYYPFLSKSPVKRIPTRFPNWAPMGRDTRLQGIFTSVLVYLFLSFPQSSW